MSSGYLIDDGKRCGQCQSFESYNGLDRCRCTVPAWVDPNSAMSRFNAALNVNSSLAEICDCFQKRAQAGMSKRHLAELDAQHRRFSEAF